MNLPEIGTSNRIFFSSFNEEVKKWYKFQSNFFLRELNKPDNSINSFYKYSAIKFAHKIYAIEKQLEKNVSEYLIWLDSDVITLKKMDYVKPKILMSVTPQILITSEVKSLINHLEKLYDDWEYTMMTVKARWSEYTLYWLYIDEKKLYRRSKIPLSDNATNIWFYNGNLKESIKNLFENKKQYFGVIQSNVPEHNYTDIEKEVKEYMRY
jgi:hypothetical protein